MNMIIFRYFSPCNLAETDGRYCLVMEAANTCETTFIFYQATRRSILEDNRLHTRCHKNIKSHSSRIILIGDDSSKSNHIFSSCRKS